jgi:hypothetical protein
VEPDRKPPLAQEIISTMIRMKRFPRKRYMFLALLLVTYFVYRAFLIMGAETPPSQSYQYTGRYVYVDDVSITVDGKLVYSTSFPFNGSTGFPNEGLNEFKLGDSKSISLSLADSHSAPCSVRFSCYPNVSNNYKVAALSLKEEVVAAGLGAAAGARAAADWVGAGANGNGGITWAACLASGISSPKIGRAHV